MSQQNFGLRAFKTGAGISAPLNPYLRFKQVAAADANGYTGTILLAGPLDEVVGISQAFVNKAGDNTVLALRTYPGSRKVACASVCAIGQVLYGTTNGQVDTLGTNGLGTAGGALGSAEFVALEACATAGGVVEALAVQPAGLGLLFASTADSAAVTNSTSEVAFGTSYSFNGPELRVSDAIRIRAHAIVTGFSSGTLTVKLYFANALGGTAVVSTGAVTNAANDEILIEALLTVRAIGATGSIVASGFIIDGTPGTATAKGFGLGATTVNISGTTTVQVSAQWSAASAGNTVILRDLIVELVRQ